MSPSINNNITAYSPRQKITQGTRGLDDYYRSHRAPKYSASTRALSGLLTGSVCAGSSQASTRSHHNKHPLRRRSHLPSLLFSLCSVKK